jgi:thiol-disulfide isomerase/thioredoxin
MNQAILLVFILFAVSSTAQIKVKIKGGARHTYYLESFSINGYQKIDSSNLISDLLTFQVTEKTPPGMYRIGDSKEGFEFLLNEPEVQFETSSNAFQDSLKVIVSHENQVYTFYQKSRDKAYLHLDLLNQVLAYYDPATEYYHTTLNEFTGLQDRFFKWTDSVIQSSPNALVSHFIRADIKPKIEPGLALNAQKKFFQAHWFDNVDWMDNTMMSSDVLTSKITSYLGLYSNPGIGKAELSQGFMIAVDKILPQAKQNPVIYDFTLKYLIRGFERYGFDDVILHIATNYSSSQQCENEQQSETMVRLEKYKLMAPGKIAPDIRMSDISGKEVIVSGIKSRKLVIFWASWCPHCIQLLPQIISWSREASNMDIKVIPISLDVDRKALEKTINELKIPWPVLVDYKKWSCQAAIDYNIYATPTMLLLDEQNIILAKPMNESELRQASR